MKTLVPVFVTSLLVVPGMASAQHQAGGAASVGTATSAGSTSSSGDGSSTGASDGGAMAPTPFAGHRVPGGSPSRVSANTANGVFTNYEQLSPVPAFGRPRNGQSIIGTAMPRSATTPPSTGAVTYIEGAYNPWIYAYEGLAETPFVGLYDPFAFDERYSIAQGTSTSSTPASEQGVLHFNVKPRDAQVYIDGARVGKADEFDGLLHKLRLEAGVHRVELRAPGYQPIVVNVRIQGGESMTYRGLLEKDAK